MKKFFVILVAIAALLVVFGSVQGTELPVPFQPGVRNALQEYQELVLQRSGGGSDSFMFPGDLPLPDQSTHSFDVQPVDQYGNILALFFSALDQSHRYVLVVDMTTDERPGVILIYVDPNPKKNAQYIYHDGLPIPHTQEEVADYLEKYVGKHGANFTPAVAKGGAYNQLTLHDNNGTAFVYFFPADLPDPIIKNYDLMYLPLDKVGHAWVLQMDAKDESHRYVIVFENIPGRPAVTLTYAKDFAEDGMKYPQTTVDFIYKDGIPVPATYDAVMKRIEMLQEKYSG